MKNKIEDKMQNSHDFYKLYNSTLLGRIFPSNKTISARRSSKWEKGDLGST